MLRRELAAVAAGWLLSSFSATQAFASDFGPVRLNESGAYAAAGQGLAVTSSGSFATAWFEDRGTARGDVYLRRAAVDGTVLGAPVRLNQADGWYADPAVDAGGSGDFVAIWTSAVEDQNHRLIHRQRFSASGAPKDVDTVLNPEGVMAGSWAMLDVNPRGDHLVAWYEYEPVALRLRTYDPSGQLSGPVITAPDLGIGNFHVGLAADRSVVAVTQTDTTSGYRLQCFTPQGAPAGAVRTLQSNQPGPTHYYGGAALTMVADGSFVLAWTELNVDASGVATMGISLRHVAAGCEDTLWEQVIGTIPYDWAQQYQSLRVAASPDGSKFALTWGFALHTGFVQTFDLADGAMLGEAHALTELVHYLSALPVAVDNAGVPTAAWAQENFSGAYGVFASGTYRDVADLSLALSVESPVIHGELTEMRAMVANESAREVSGVTAAFAFAPALQFESAATPGWTCVATDAGADCTEDGVFAAGRADEVVLQVRATGAPGTYAVSARVASSAADAEPGNDIGTADMVVKSRPVDLVLDLATDRSSIGPGESLKLTATVTNIAPLSFAEHSAFEVALPTDFVLTGVAGTWSCTGDRTVYCTHAGALGAGQSSSAVLSVRAPYTVGNYVFLAEAHSPQAEVSTYNNYDSAEVRVAVCGVSDVQSQPEPNPKLKLNPGGLHVGVCGTNVHVK